MVNILLKTFLGLCFIKFLVSLGKAQLFLGRKTIHSEHRERYWILKGSWKRVFPQKDVGDDIFRAIGPRRGIYLCQVERKHTLNEKSSLGRDHSGSVRAVWPMTKGAGCFFPPAGEGRES